MSARAEGSAMWRTTYALGAFAFAMVLAYVGVLLGGDPEHGMAFRVVAAGVLALGACACAGIGLREMGVGKSDERPRPGAS